MCAVEWDCLPAMCIEEAGIGSLLFVYLQHLLVWGNHCSHLLLLEVCVIINIYYSLKKLHQYIWFCLILFAEY